MKHVEEKLRTQVKKVVFWSGGCASQFRSRYVFHLLSTFYPTKEFEWHYNHGKGPMDGVGGTVKNIVFKEVKSGRLSIKTPRQFAEAADKLVAIDCLYLPEDGLLNEPDNIKIESPKIPDTLKIHSGKKSGHSKYYILTILRAYVRHRTLLPTILQETRRSHRIWTYVSRQLG